MIEPKFKCLGRRFGPYFDDNGGILVEHVMIEPKIKSHSKSPSLKPLIHPPPPPPQNIFPKLVNITLLSSARSKRAQINFVQKRHDHAGFSRTVMSSSSSSQSSSSSSQSSSGSSGGSSSASASGWLTGF